MINPEFKNPENLSESAMEDVIHILGEANMFLCLADQDISWEQRIFWIENIRKDCCKLMGIEYSPYPKFPKED